jgi:hypothetical protein
MFGSFWILTTGFWILMIFDCVQNERDRQLWIYILIFTNAPGALVYFIARWLPRANIPIPKYFSRGKRKRELWIAQSEAKNIGKAHQFVKVGNILCDMGMFDKAEDAYKQALEQEGKNIQALWGAASINLRNKNFASAKEHLATLLKLDPDHKYGDASLAYGKSLFVLKDFDAAKLHLEKHIKNWAHPEACMMLSEILSRQGNYKEARICMETMLTKLKGSSYYHYKNNKHFVSKGEKLLRSLDR